MISPTNSIRLEGEYYPLSPSAPLSKPIVEILVTARLAYPTLKKAYHAARAGDLETKLRIVTARSDQELYDLIPKVPREKDWDKIKERVMYHLIRDKFSESSQRRTLLSTGDKRLIHISDSEDPYWGETAEGVGHNRYGVLLMRYRQELLSME